MSSELSELTFSTPEEWEEWGKENSLVFIPEFAKSSKGQKFMKKRGSDFVYEVFEEGCKCVKCDSEILVAEISHPIWDGPGMGGSGKCHLENVPYCPKCEKKPNYSGSQIIAN
jgi:hypothetical protein